MTKYPKQIDRNIARIIKQCSHCVLNFSGPMVLQRFVDLWHSTTKFSYASRSRGETKVSALRVFWHYAPFFGADLGRTRLVLTKSVFFLHIKFILESRRVTSLSNGPIIFSKKSGHPTKAL